MSFKKFVLVLCVALLTLSIVGCGLIDTDFSSKFSHYEDEEWCEFGDGGEYMRIDTNPKNIEGVFESDAWKAIEEINEELGFSKSVYNKMGETRPIDGRQEEESDDGYVVSWTYSADDGLEVTYEND